MNLFSFYSESILCFLKIFELGFFGFLFSLIIIHIAFPNYLYSLFNVIHLKPM